MEERRLCPDCGHDDPHTSTVDGQQVRCSQCLANGGDAYTLCLRFDRGTSARHRLRSQKSNQDAFA